VDCQDVKNSNVILEKYSEYLEFSKELIASMIRLDHKLSLVNTVVSKMPEINKMLLAKLREVSYDLAPFKNTIDIMSLPLEQLVELKNKFIYFQESNFLDMLLKLTKNVARSKLDKVTYPEFIKKCSTGDCIIYLVEGVNPLVDVTPSRFVIHDLCVIWDMGEISTTIPSDIKEAIFVELLSLVKSGKSIYETRKRPDIDVEDMFRLLTKYLRAMKKDFPGCDRALALIENASAIFKSGYSTYYKKMVQSGSPMSIIEEFTSDIIKDTAETGSVKDLVQLRKLSRHIKKLIVQHTKNKNQKIPEHVRQMMTSLEDCFDSFISNDSDGTEVDAAEMNKKFEEMMGKMTFPTS
jgi:uncharacterized protein YjgD (DUF1641 family)